jgi:hypothetical protein
MTTPTLKEPLFLKNQLEYIGSWTVEYEWIHCNGVAIIKVIKETEKVTYPMIEFCPFCGMSNEWPKATEDDE